MSPNQADGTIVLDLPSDVAAARLTGTLDRMEQQGADFHARVRQGFLDEAERQTEAALALLGAEA